MNAPFHATRFRQAIVRFVGSGACLLACAGTAPATASYVQQGGEPAYSQHIDVGAAKHGNVDVPGSPAVAKPPTSCPKTADAIVGWLNADGPNACKRELRGG